MEDMLNKLRETIETALGKIVQKGADISPAELENATKAICLIEKIKQLSDSDEKSSYRRSMMGSHRRRSCDDGYSGHSIKDRMIARLEEMIDEAKSEHERQTVEDWIRIIRRDEN